jgi:ornithine carbamoyltransferase
MSDAVLGAQPTHLSLDAKHVKQAPGTVIERIGNQMVALDERTDRYLVIDTVGADIWALAATPQSLEALVNELLRHYQVDRHVLERDVEAFVNNMVSFGLFVEE